MTDGESTVKVFAGICAKNTTVHVKMNDDMTVSVTLESDCPMVTKNPLPPISPYEEIATPMNQSAVYKWASENIGHTACPVPCAIIKGIEVASGMALKKNPIIEIE